MTDNIDNIENTERTKYREMYGEGSSGIAYRCRHGEVYGNGCWGENAIPFIKAQNIKSLVDVGCGAGKFCILASKFIPTVYGVDIASIVTNNIIPDDKVKYLDGEAKSIPLPDKSVQYVTCFDCIEHCPPEDIDAIFAEMRRVSTVGMILSISSMHDYHYGVILHLTVEPQEWWIEKLKKYGTVLTFGGTESTGVPYIHVKY